MKMHRLFIIMLLIVSCSKKEDQSDEKAYFPAEPAPHNNQANAVGKVPLVIRIEPYMQEAVDNRWTEKDWIENVGTPNFSRSKEDIKILEYIETGPYNITSPKMITGIVIILDQGVTKKVEYHYMTH